MNLKKASFINALSKFSKIFLSLAINAILSRILTPEDYGIVAVITVFSTFFSTFSDMGFGAAIIQNKELTQEDTDNIYSFTFYVAGALTVLFALLSFPIAVFYQDDCYIPLGLMLSISLFFNALNMVPNGILNRDKKFVLIAVRTIIVYVGTSVLTIILALMGLRYYALAIQAILTSVITYFWNAWSTRPKLYLKFSTTSLKKVMSYSGFQFGFNIVNYFSRNLDNLLTGKFFGNAELGFYNKSYNLMLYPVNNLTGIVSPVLHPILADYQKNPKTIYEKYMKILKLLANLGIFIAPVCVLAGSELIEILYGPNWSDSVICFQLLALAIIPQMINSCTGSIFQAIGQTKLLFINSCINTSITVVAIVLGIFCGRNISALSAFVAVAYNIHFITASVMLICMGFRYKLSSYVHQLLPQIIMILCMIVAVVLYPFHIQNVFLSALVKGCWLGIVYLAVLVITKEYRVFLSLLKKRS